MTRSQDGRIQNCGNNCFVPMADAGYLSVRVIQQFFSKNLHFYACAGNTPCGVIAKKIYMVVLSVEL